MEQARAQLGSAGSSAARLPIPCRVPSMAAWPWSQIRSDQRRWLRDTHPAPSEQHDRLSAPKIDADGRAVVRGGFSDRGRQGSSCTLRCFGAHRAAWLQNRRMTSCLFSTATASSSMVKPFSPATTMSGFGVEAAEARTSAEVSFRTVTGRRTASFEIEHSERFRLSRHGNINLFAPLRDYFARLSWPGSLRGAIASFGTVMAER
jgi:hypothetical protein